MATGQILLLLRFTRGDPPRGCSPSRWPSSSVGLSAPVGSASAASLLASSKALAGLCFIAGRARCGARPLSKSFGGLREESKPVSPYTAYGAGDGSYYYPGHCAAIIA